MSVVVSKELSRMLQTEVSIRNINIGLLNRIILDDVSICDREGGPLLEASRMSAWFSPTPPVKRMTSTPFMAAAYAPMYFFTR